MSDFLSDEDMQKMEASQGGSPDFISDEHMASLNTPDHESEASPLASGIRQFAQGATGNFSDEIAGGIEAGGRALGINGLGGPMKDISSASDGPTLDWEVLKDAYKRARDKERATLAKDSKDNPKTSFAANMGGAIVSPLNKIAAGMSPAKAGMVLGGMTGLGGSDKEDLGGIAEDTALSTALGGVLGKGVEKASPYIESGIKKASNGASDLADRFAARALGAERGTIKSLGFDKVKAAGRQALDEGVLSPLASTDDLVTRNAALKQRGGEMMGQAYDAIDQAGASTFNPLDAATKVEDKLGDFYRSPINRGETNQLENTLDSIMMRGDKNIPLSDAQALKEEVGKVANWKNKLNITDKEKMARDAYGVISSEIDDAVKNGADTIQKAGLSDILSKGKQLYSRASTADSLLENKVAREQGNKILGLTDWAVLGGGAAAAPVTGGASIPATLAIEGVKKGLEKYGAQNAALGLDKISKTLMKSPQMAALYQRNPQAFAALAQKMANKIAPEESHKDQINQFEPESILQKTQGTKYAGVLQDAAKRGPEAVRAATFVLQGRDPEYRKLMIGDEDQTEDDEENFDDQ